MRLAALALAVLVAVPLRPLAAARPQARGALARSAAPKDARHGGARRPAAPSLEDARAALKTLMRDRDRRRYRHNWERAIDGLLRAAHGRDAAPGFLDAAHARYALYRWSANEADREEALRLADRAARAGARDAPAFAAAIRREAGDERPATPRRSGARPAAPHPEPAPSPAEEEEAAEPALEAAVADLAEERPAQALPLGTSSAEGAATVSEVKTWSSADYTRIAVYLSHWVGWQKQDLAPEGGHPRRLALDLRPATLAGSALARAVEGARVDRVRAAQNDPDTVRVVLDLPGAEAVHAFGLDDPPRLIVDVGTRTTPRPPDAGGGASPEAAPAGTVRPAAAPEGEGAGEAPERGPIRRIVVDAGHGGHDPGAIGPTGVREKDVTLAIARRLAAKLRGAGFEVSLTRSDDRFLALEERTAIANTARGDLFVSVHANANPRRSMAGVETYYLNVTDDRYAARLAARENGLDPGGESGGAQVLRILTDFEAKSSAALSQGLALAVQKEVCGAVRGRFGDARDLGVKGALFYVLVGARMPAVLVETAFISNRAEERRLAAPRYQDEVAGAIARAIAGFAGRGNRVAAAASGPRGRAVR